METSCLLPPQTSFPVSPLAYEVCPLPVQSGLPLSWSLPTLGITGPVQIAPGKLRRSHPNHGRANLKTKHMVRGGSPQLASDHCVARGGPYIRCWGTPA